MGLNIQELLKLDRLRDEKVEGTGVKRIVEICRNPDKVLKETEEYIYEKVEVIDGAFIKNRGIIDEIVRMTFHDETYERSLNNHYRKNKSTVELYGFYLRYRKTTASHPFDLLFRKSEKAYMSKFKRDDGRKGSEECFEEDHRSQARLLVFEILCGANEKFNVPFKRKFNLDITNINDFKIILLDEKLAEDVQKYITSVVVNEAMNVAHRGRNQDYIYGFKKKNGVLEKYSKKINTFYLDKASQDNEKSDGYSFIKIEDGVYEDEIVDKAFILDEEEELIDTDNLYRYLIKNIDKILTKSQAEYVRALFKNKGDEYLKNINEKHAGTYKSNYKYAIQKSIEAYLDKSTYVTKSNNKFEFKESVLVALENILNKTTNKDIFIELCNYLKKENNTVLENILIDIIYSLDFKYYKSIIDYIKLNKMNNEYIEGDFKVVIEELQRAYNWYAKNNNVIYNLNRSNKEIQVEKYMNKILEGKKEGAVAESRGNHEYVTLAELRDFLSGIEGKKVRNKELNEVLNKYGYCISSTTTSLNTIIVFKVYIKGYEPQKRKINRDYKSIREFKLNKKQMKSIEKYIDNNLKIDRLLANNEAGYLSIKDVIELVEKELNITKLKRSELSKVLTQCNYDLDIKKTTAKLNKKSYNAFRIKKIK